jgi:Alcohol dehydrogenase GroES-like domain
MSKMRAMIVPKPGGRLRMEERDLPEPSRHEVRIRVHACRVCHSDSITVEGRVPGLSYPRIPGHEVIGVIDALGPNVEGWDVGARAGAPVMAATPPTCWHSPRRWRTFRRPSILWSPRRSSAPALPHSMPFGTAARSRAIWWRWTWPPGHTIRRPAGVPDRAIPPVRPRRKPEAIAMIPPFRALSLRDVYCYAQAWLCEVG